MFSRSLCPLSGLSLSPRFLSRLVLVLVIFTCGLSALAQTPGAREKAKEKEEPPPMRLRDLSWSEVDTPDYSVAASERSTRVEKWGRIETDYDTFPDWIDELEFRYFVLVYNKKKKDTEEQYMMFTRNIVYVDIKKGRQHLSTVFIRPNTLARHGKMERMAVEVYYKGKRIAAETTDKDPRGDWWLTSKAQAMARTGYLWTRPETPFAFVAYDKFEQIRQK